MSYVSWTELADIPNSKYDKTGGPISGNVSVTGNVSSTGSLTANSLLIPQIPRQVYVDVPACVSSLPGTGSFQLLGSFDVTYLSTVDVCFLTIHASYTINGDNGDILTIKVTDEAGIVTSPTGATIAEQAQHFRGTASGGGGTRSCTAFPIMKAYRPSVLSIPSGARKIYIWANFTKTTTNENSDDTVTFSPAAFNVRFEQIKS
jgi:hypothetical protein